MGLNMEMGMKRKGREEVGLEGMGFVFLECLWKEGALILYSREISNRISTRNRVSRN